MVDSVCRSLRDGAIDGEFAPVIMLYDSLNTYGGAAVFTHFLRSLASNISLCRAQAKGLVLVAADRPPESYQALLTLEESKPSWLQVADCFNDPIGWMKVVNDHESVKEVEEDLPRCILCVGDLQCLMSTIFRAGKLAMGSNNKARFSIAIDSVSSLLRYNSVQIIAKFLSTLRSHGEVSSILWLMHSDLHDSRTLSALEYISSTIISIEQYGRPVYGNNAFEVASNAHYNVSNREAVRIRQKRRNGRVREQVEEFKREGFTVKFSPVTMLTPVGTENIIIPQVQFNLQLTDKEREDRAKVVLPFEHQGDGKVFSIYNGRTNTKSTLFDVNVTKTDLAKLSIDHGSSSNKAGEVNYLRDSDDERPDSDEDPDDDLDI